MKFIQETTDWKFPNHIYLVTDNRTKMLGYVKAGTNTLEMFGGPRDFETRGRKFKVVPNKWGYAEKQDPPKQLQWEVTGSKGDKYIVTEERNGLTCTCPGFTFRGQCKHINQVQEYQNKNG